MGHTNSIRIQNRRYTRGLLKMWEPTITYPSVKGYGINIIMNNSGTLKKVHYFESESERDSVLNKLDDLMGIENLNS